MYAKSVTMTATDTARFKYPNSGNLSYKAVKELFMPVKTPEIISFMTKGSGFASLVNDDNLFPIRSIYADINYWKVFNFHFVAGKPFSKTDYASGLKVVVLSESTAMKLFGSVDVVGKDLEYGFKQYRITGVVKDVSYLMSDTYAQIWMPFTSMEDYDKERNERGGMLGEVSKVFLLARDKSDFESIRKEVNENVRRYNAQATDWKADLLGQPDEKTKEVQRIWSNKEPDIMKNRIRNLLIVLLLLLVPAINLSGMNSSRMERRLDEMGVRKAFGASRKALIIQILTENLLLTGLGGIVGLLLSYLMLFFTRNWILDLGKDFAHMLPDYVAVDFSLSMLFNLQIFFILLAVCFMMNVLSALIPVYRSLRKNITDSLYIKYN